MVVHTTVKPLHVDFFHFPVIIEFFLGEVNATSVAEILASGPTLPGAPSVVIPVDTLFGRGPVIILIEIVIIRPFHHLIQNQIVPVLL